MNYARSSAEGNRPKCEKSSKLFTNGRKSKSRRYFIYFIIRILSPPKNTKKKIRILNDEGKWSLRNTYPFSENFYVLKFEKKKSMRRFWSYVKIVYRTRACRGSSPRSFPPFS